MSRSALLASTTVGGTLLGLAFAGLVTAAEIPSSSVLTGKVTSQAEGSMEGVIIGAKKVGSPITTWVVSNTQGQYTFPRGRLEPGKYAINVRAVGYELRKTSVDVTAESAQLDLQLIKVTNTSKLAMQLSNGELLMSVPGTPQQKLALGGCVNCHTLQRVLFSHFDADEMTQVVQRMSMHTNNSSPIHPWMRPVAYPAHSPEEATPFAKYLSLFGNSIPKRAK
jgi:virginiamycin B lyase